MTRRSLLSFAAVLVLSGIGHGSQNANSSNLSGRFTTRVLATGLEGPWEIVWGPDGFLWVTERVGKRVIRINPADGSRATAVTIPDVHQSVSQDGLLGMALHPDLLRGRGTDYVYVALTYDADPGPGVTRRGRIRRYTYDQASRTLGSPVDVISGLPVGDDHVSGRLAFGPDGKLYLSVGDEGSNFLANYCNPNRAQDLPTASEVAAQDWTTYQGKVLRVNPDGSIPPDNPTIGGARSHIYTYGHRNVQGLVFGPDRRLYASEHGPSTDDEVNLLEAGKNYGWPNVAGYRDDRAYVYGNWSAAGAACRTLRFNPNVIPPQVPQQKETAWNHPDFRPPLRTFFTVDNGYDFEARGGATVAPSGLDLYALNAIPRWQHSLLMTGLKTGTLYRMKLSDDGKTVAGDTENLFKTVNRYRDLAIAPDGRTIYLVTDNEGPTTDMKGTPTRSLANPGSVLVFTYEGRP
jgi:PQQ-dependent dehydrogenase (s-GDH family)